MPGRLLIIPAIDLRHGHCVRVRQGRFEDEDVYYADPVRMAKLWRVQNAKALHVVDHDALANRDTIGRIAAALDIPVQVSGDPRTMADVEGLLDLGVYRVVLKTVAVHEPALVAETIRKHSCSRIVVGIEADDGVVLADGAPCGADAVELAVAMEAMGVRRIIYKDVARDGTLAGPNIAAYRALGAALSRAKVTAAGGVGGYLDLLALQGLDAQRVDSVIVGRALYENRFPCQQFWGWHDKARVDLDAFSTAPLAPPDALPLALPAERCE